MSEVDYEGDDLGIASSRIVTTVLVIITCIVVARTIHDWATHELKYPRISIIMVVILLAPGIFSILALFGLFWESETIDVIVELIKGLVVASWIYYVFSMVGAELEETDGKVIYNHESLRNHISSVGVLNSTDYTNPKNVDSFLWKAKIGAWQFILIVPVIGFVEFF